ncbi:MAG: hypothetical protein CM15mP12_7810 [Gammaproteobacteria bacterium]|nr:MAG: hypothetical protein CM15mP12_7810 [Gammaproteobacteria bacterium]
MFQSNELFKKKKNEFKENKVVMIKGTVSADDYRKKTLRMLASRLEPELCQLIFKGFWEPLY